MKVKDQMKQLLLALNEGLYEKEETMALALLSAIAGESIFLLGAPGVAKSLIARRLKFAFNEGKAFEYLMNRFSTPDEIFGPVSIKALKEDKYERLTDDYLPGATVVFLDEIWKAGPSIQNALLTVLNEKVYRNGAQEVKVPMKALISASNELPAKGEGLEALLDRFIVRLLVGGISDKQAFNNMIVNQSNAYEDNIAPALKITDHQFNQWSKAIDKISVPENVLNVIQVIRAAIQEHNNNDNKNGESIYVSDRRWRKIIRLMRTSAFLNDRMEVDLMDCFLILHCIWDEVEQADTVSRLVKASISKHGYKLKVEIKDLKTLVEELESEVLRDTKNEKTEVTEELIVKYEEYYFIEGLSDYPLISKDAYEQLSKEEEDVRLYPDSANDYNRRYHGSEAYMKKSKRENHVIIDGKEHKLKVNIEKEQTVTTFKPNERLKKAWNEVVENFLAKTQAIKEEIKQFRTKDLAHLRNNLFVNPSEASHVETNLTSSLADIEKLEVEVKRIQHYYENVASGTSKTKL